jgi:hypothetical protein
MAAGRKGKLICRGMGCLVAGKEIEDKKEPADPVSRWDGCHPDFVFDCSAF